MTETMPPAGGFSPPAPGHEPGLPPVVPTPRARRILLFEFSVLIEYWVAPVLFGLTNYAGTWSDVGIGLFVLFVGSLAVWVLRPLRRHISRATSSRRQKLLFHGVWTGTLFAGLFVTNTFQLGITGSSHRAVEVGSTTVYTPFGAWPSATFYVPSWGVFGTLNPEILTVLFLVSILGASAIAITSAQRGPACPEPARRGTTASQTLARLAIWSPLGLITGCASCAPLYLSGMGFLVPAVAATGFSVVPLVPWIGLAGLLYLGSIGLALHLIRKATEAGHSPSPEP